MLAISAFCLLSVYWARAAYIAQQRLNEAKAAKASTAQLQEAYDRAKRAAEEAAAKLGQALKAEADAKRAVEREKQREMLKDMKEKNKADKEKQKQVGTDRASYAAQLLPSVLLVALTGCLGSACLG